MYEKIYDLSAPTLMKYVYLIVNSSIFDDDFHLNWFSHYFYHFTKDENWFKCSQILPFYWNQFYLAIVCSNFNFLILFSRLFATTALVVYILQNIKNPLWNGKFNSKLRETSFGEIFPRKLKEDFVQFSKSISIIQKWNETLTTIKFSWIYYYANKTSY